MTDIVEELKQQQRRDTRRAWWFGVGALLAVLGGVGFVWLQDIAPPHDAAMLPIFTEGGGRNNELLSVVRELEPLDLDAMYSRKLSSAAKQVRLGAEQEVKDFFAGNGALLAAWERLVKSDATQWRWRLQDEEVITHPHIKFTGLGSLQTLAGFMNLRVQVLAREGKMEDAVQLAMEIRKVGQGLQRSEGALYHWLTGVNIEAKGLAALEDALALTKGEDSLLLRVQKGLAKEEEVRLPEFGHALQVDYLLEKKRNISSDQLQDGDKFATKVKLLFSYKKNRSLLTWMRFRQPLVEAAGRGDAEFRKALANVEVLVAEWNKRGWKNTVHPNGYGDALAIQPMPWGKAVGERYFAAKNIRRMTQVMLAMRRYELAKGSLPRSLDELVPEYLDEVPLDAVDGKPLRWDSRRQRVYSVYRDGIDNGGDFRSPRDFGGRDHGACYLWGKEMSEWYEEGYRPQESGKKRRKTAPRKTVPAKPEGTTSAP